nr:MAG TPA: hypothetical protein [Caudoviricetes sp.]
MRRIFLQNSVLRAPKCGRLSTGAIFVRWSNSGSHSSSRPPMAATRHSRSLSSSSNRNSSILSMNNNRLTASKSKAALEEQSYDLIQQHIIDPENSPLPEHLRVQCNRVLQIARLLDDYPNESHIINIMLAKYRISRTQIRKDIALAKELFKTQHQFDWDFWYAWMIKDQIQLIRDCKLKGDLKQWNNAKKVLHQMIGEKPASVEDPRRMEKNVFYIQINSMGQKVDIPLNAIRNLSQEEQKVLVDSMYTPIDDVQAEEIMNS